MIEEHLAFFYDENPNDPFYNLWTKFPQFLPKDLDKLPYEAKGILYKKGKTLKLTKNRVYYIAGEYLYYKEKEESKKIKGLLQFSNVSYAQKIEKMQGKSMKTLYYLKLERNEAKTKLFTFDQDVFQNFHRALLSRCILDSFQKDYKMIKMIGKGSFAKVYLAQSLNTKEFYAVKAFYKDQVLAQSSGRSALLNEIDIMRKLSGRKNLLQLYEVYESKNSIYFVVDLLEGGELLDDLTPENPYKESKMAELLKNILEALNYVHDKNIIHRDLKPENILLRTKNNQFNIVIADFGLATPIHQDLRKVVFKRCGTPGYVAPEILLYKDSQSFYETNSDVFSVGVIFYIMVCAGTRPFKGADAHETIINNKKCQPDFSRAGFEKLTLQGFDLMRKMLDPDPKRRLNCAEALQHAFFKMSDKDHDVFFKDIINNDANLFKSSLMKAQEKQEEEKSAETFTFNPENYALKIDSTQKLMKSPSNNFEYKNNCLNGRIETLIDSTKLSSSKYDEENSSKNSKNSPKNNSSRFSGIGVGGGSQSPEKLELNFEGTVRRSTGNFRREDEELEEGRKNRSSLSPSHRKQNKGNEIYKMAIMNQKKKNENEMIKK